MLKTVYLQKIHFTVLYTTLFEKLWGFSEISWQIWQKVLNSRRSGLLKTKEWVKQNRKLLSLKTDNMKKKKILYFHYGNKHGWQHFISGHMATVYELKRTTIQAVMGSSQKNIICSGGEKTRSKGRLFITFLTWYIGPCLLRRQLGQMAT